MLDGVNGLGPMKDLTAPAAAAKAAPAEGQRSFKDILQDSIASVGRLQQEADRVLEKYATGQTSEDQALIAFRKSQIAFETLMQIRNKLVDAFQQIQQMRV
jgi:flagellar hook-basal body complex protein FliE